eukprot:scaffold771_cov387-Prasinococcus_capsulatus_cf.AAC.8
MSVRLRSASPARRAAECSAAPASGPATTAWGPSVGGEGWACAHRRPAALALALAAARWWRGTPRLEACTQAVVTARRFSGRGHGRSSATRCQGPPQRPAPAARAARGARLEHIQKGPKYSNLKESIAEKARRSPH